MRKPFSLRSSALFVVGTLLVASAGCYHDLDYGNIQCDINDKGGCPSGYVCGVSGMCVKPSAPSDARSAEDGVLPSVDAGSGDQPGSSDQSVDSVDGPETSIDQGAGPDSSKDQVLAVLDTASPDATIVDASGADGNADDVPLSSDAVLPDARPAVDVAPEAVSAKRSWNLTQIESQSGYGVANESVAMDPASANAVVGWIDNGVLAARYTAATDSWSAATPVSSQADVALVRAAADAAGHFVLVWSKRGDGTDDVAPGIWASYSTGGEEWSAPVQLWSGGRRNWNNDIRIAMNRSGQAMVIWSYTENPSTSSSPPDKLYSAYIEGTANRPAALVATWPSAAVKAYARVAIDGSGNGLITWVAPDTTAAVQSIWAATFSKASVGQASLLEDNDEDAAELPTVAMNAMGQGIVVWRQDGSNACPFYARRYSVTGGWSTTTELVDRPSLAYRGATSLDSYGTANLVFSRSNSSGYQATFASQSGGGSWKTEALEKDNQASAPGYSGVLADIDPQIALDAQGNVLAGWSKKTGDNEYVPHLRWRTGGVWGEDVEIGKVLDMFSSELLIAVSDDGHAVAGWTYYHCDYSVTNYANVICPSAKAMKDVSAASIAAAQGVHVAVYR